MPALLIVSGTSFGFCFYSYISPDTVFYTIFSKKTSVGQLLLMDNQCDLLKVWVKSDDGNLPATTIFLHVLAVR